MTNHTATFAPLKRVLAVAGLGIVGAAALTGCGALDDDSDDDTNSTEVSEDAYDAAADAGPGDCLPEEVLGGDSGEFAIDCADDTAFWTITAITADSGATASAGDLADYAPVFELCGDEVGAYLPGQVRTDWNMIYDQASGNVDYLFCIEAIDKENAEGATPIVPDSGDCFSSADNTGWNTLACDDPAADATVTNAVTFDAAEWESVDAAAAAEAECSGAGYYELVDQFSRTNGLLCLE